MPRHRISIDSVTTAAATIADREGITALSLSGVASALGVGPSALYTHIDGLDGLRYQVAVRATGRLADRIRTAAIGVYGPTALVAMGKAYRRFAHDHPGQFAATLLAGGDDVEDLADANRSIMETFALVYAGMGLGPEDSLVAARSTRSAIHGYLALEHNTGPSGDDNADPGHDAEYEHLIHALRRALVAD